MEETNEGYTTWWNQANEQLDKISPDREHGFRMIMEQLFSDFRLMKIACPTLTVSEEEVILVWEKENRRVVIGPGDHGECHMLLPELSTGPLIPLLPNQIDEFCQWFKGGSPVPEKKTPQKPKENIMNMMDNMFKAFGLEDMLEKMDGPSSQDQDTFEPTPLDPMGCFLLTIFLGILRMFSWIVFRVSSRIHMRGAIKGLIMDTVKDVEDGYWNDIFSSPDQFVYDLSPRLHKLVSFLFQGVNFSIRHKVLTTSIVMFIVGYRIGSI